MSGLIQEPAIHTPTPQLLPRRQLLVAMRTALAQSSRLLVTDDATGFHGNGKSELARAYALAFESDYDHVLWLRGHEPAVFTAECAELAFELGALAPGDHQCEVLIDAVRARLQSSNAWLLVIDGVTNLDGIAHLVDGIANGHVLATGRPREYPAPFQPFWVPAFDESEVIAYLDDEAEALGRLNGHRAALTVFREPATARLAAVYRDRLGAPLPRVAEVVCAARECGEAPLTRLVGGILRGLQSQRPVLFHLAAVCAHLDITFIPATLLFNGRTFLPRELSNDLVNVARVRAALDELAEFGLVRSTGNGASMPTAIRTAVVAHLSEEERRAWAGRAVRIALDAFPHEDQYHGYLASCSRLLGVTLASSRRCIELGCELDAVGTLLNRAGQYLHGFGDAEAARRCLERSARIAIVQHGYQSPILALRLNNLGAAEVAANDPQAARQHFEQAIAIIRSQESAHRALMSEILRNISNAYLACGDTDGARKWLKEALARHRHYYGRNHAYVVECLNQLGLVFAKSGRALQALKSFHHAVTIGREVKGIDPTLFALCLTNLGDALRREGELVRAEACFLEALQHIKAAESADRTQIANLLTRIGRTKRRRRLFGEAAALFEQAFALGADTEGSPAGFARQIGRTHSLDDNPRAALAWYRKAIALYESQDGTRDPGFLKLLIETGEMALKHDDDAGAEKCFRRAHALREAGIACPNHYAAKMLSGLGQVQERRANYDAAMGHYVGARSIYQREYGSAHPDVARQMTHIGRCLYRLGRGFEAVANIVHAERILSEELGSSHSDTRRARELLEQLRD